MRKNRNKFRKEDLDEPRMKKRRILVEEEIEMEEIVVGTAKTNNHIQDNDLAQDCAPVKPFNKKNNQSDIRSFCKTKTKITPTKYPHPAPPTPPSHLQQA